MDNVHFAYVRTQGLYFVCTTKFNVSPLLTVELLTRISRVIKDYCGILSEESLRLNFSLVYELMDEVVVRTTACVRPKCARFDSPGVRPFLLPGPGRARYHGRSGRWLPAADDDGRAPSARL